MSDNKQSEKPSSQKLPSWLTSGSVIMGVVLLMAVALMYYPTPTRVSLEIPVSRVEMTLGVFPTQQILNPLEVESISFGNFYKIELHPSSLRVANPQQYDMESDSFPRDAWQSLTEFGYLQFSSKPQGTRVTVQPENRNQPILGILDPIHVREESHVVFEVDGHDPRTVTIKISGSETRVIFTPTRRFEIIADETKFEGIKDFPFPEEASLTFRPELPEHRSKIEILGKEQPLALTIRLSPSSNHHMFSERPITVKSLDLSRQDSTGNRVTALAGPGILRYPDFKDLSSKSVPATDFLSIGPKKIMTIKQMTLLDDKPELRLFIDGTAKHIQSGSAEFPIDHRLSKFEELWNHAKVKLLLEF